MNPVVEVYRGYKIARNSKVIWRNNPISGHYWAEPKQLDTYYISGPGSRVLDAFRSIRTCKEHIDFIIKYVAPELKQ